MRFGHDFLFGAALAAYQIEGGHNEGGKGASNWDIFSKQEGKNVNRTNGDVAIDHYHRYEEEIKLIADMVLESYRLGFYLNTWKREEDGIIRKL